MIIRSTAAVHGTQHTGTAMPKSSPEVRTFRAPARGIHGSTELPIRHVMATRSIAYSDAEIIDLWLQSQASPHTQSCYRRDSARLLAHVVKSLTRVTLGDLHSFAQSLI